MTEFDTIRLPVGLQFAFHSCSPPPFLLFPQCPVCPQSAVAAILHLAEFPLCIMSRPFSRINARSESSVDVIKNRASAVCIDGEKGCGDLPGKHWYTKTHRLNLKKKKMVCVCVCGGGGGKERRRDSFDNNAMQ